MMEGLEKGRPAMPKGKQLLLSAAGLLWLGMVLFGAVLLTRYSTSAGKNLQPPAHWPAASGLKRDNARPTLLMFMHPQCPCSRASVGELALLMAHCQGKLSTHVL